MVIGAGVVACMASACAGGENGPENDRWRGFPVFVWFYGGPERSPATYEALRRAGLAGCNVEGSDPSGAVAKAELDFYVDHTAGKGDLFLRPAAFDADRARLDRDLLGFRPVRPSCFNDESVMQRLESLVEQNVARHRGNHPLGYVLDDELSVTRGVNPMDYCFCDHCLAGVRETLRTRCGTIEAARVRWGRAAAETWRSFIDFVPPTTEAARRLNDGLPLEQVNFAAWNDHRAFMDTSFAAALARLAGAVRAGDPTAPVGYTGGQFPSAFGGFNWSESMLRGITLIEPYESGVAPELVRDFAAPAAKVVSTIFVPDDPKERAAWSSWEVLFRAARGDDGAVIWSSGALFESGGARLNATGEQLALSVRAAAELRESLKGARRAEPVVALYESAASVRAAWMVDSWGDGKTWPRRLTSYEAAHSSSVASREAWRDLLAAAGLPFRFLSKEGLGAIGHPGDSVRVIVLHAAMALGDDEIAALESFARGGGIVIADAQSFRFDEALRGRDGTAFARWFGVERTGGETLDELAKACAEAPSSAAVGAGTDRPFGAGRLLCLDGRPPNGGAADAPAARAWREWLTTWLGKQSIDAAARLDDPSLGGARLFEWRAGDETIAVVAKASRGSAPAAAPLAGEVWFRGAAAGVSFTVDERHVAIVRRRRSAGR